MDSTMTTIKQVLIGMLAYLLIASIPVLIFTQDKLKGEGGLLVGALVGFFVLLSIRSSIDHAIHMRKSSSGYFVFMSIGRMMFVGLFLFSVGWFGWLNLITTFVGIMSLKVATYMQPFTEKLINKILKK